MQLSSKENVCKFIDMRCLSKGTIFSHSQTKPHTNTHTHTLLPQHRHIQYTHYALVTQEKLIDSLKQSKHAMKLF